MKKAVFLDRDGIINIDKSYVHKINDFEFCEGIFEALNYFISLNYSLFIVTNQSGIGRGYYSEDDFDKLTTWMINEFQNSGIDIKKVYHCPHLPNGGCECRKPSPGMFEKAKKEFNLNMTNSWMIGDKTSDIQAANSAKIHNTIFINPLTCTEAKYNVKSILDTITIIKS